MSGERIDYGIERQRHEGFVGRTALLSRLDQLLVADATDRWVVVTGGPGMGKSAVLAAWLARREAAGAVVPHHFIRRGEYDWDDPAKLVSSLVAQIEAQFPGQREPDADAQKHPATRLVATLTRVSVNELVPRSKRLVVLIDGLDEYDPPAGPPTRDPLAAFLPHALPHGVSFLCASRPRHPYVEMLETRDGELMRVDLDDPEAAVDNNMTVRSFWEQAAPPLGLDARFVDEAVARADGNLQHAVTLRKRLAGLPPDQRRVAAIPRGLEALLAKMWRRIATDPIAVRGLGILCVAREALTLDELGSVAGWADEVQRQAFVHTAAEVLIETRRTDGQPEYRLHHDAVRVHIASTLGAAVIREHHRAISRQLATWPPPLDATSRRYALRHALTHRCEAGEWVGAWLLAADMSFLESKCRELGTHEAEADVARVAERCQTSGDETLGRRFHDLARALVRESHWLRDAPEATTALVWNRLRRSGWSEKDLNEQLRIPARTKFLRLQRVATRESPALVRDLVGHVGPVTTCAVTLDGRRVVSASGDQTLRVWDLESGRIVTTFEGHVGWITTCIVTPDGRRMISASHDRTLKVWDLDTGRALATFEGHTGPVTACAIAPDGRRVVSASHDRTLKVWDLNTGSAFRTLGGYDGRNVVSTSFNRTPGGHDGWVSACTVTPDGRRVVSASYDRTLKVWDLDRGRPVVTLEGHTGWVSACAVTPDGRRVVSASHDRTLKIWDLESTRVLATLEGHTGWVSACAVTPDGRRVVSASYDQTLKVWDLETGHVLATIEGHAARVTACAVTPDARNVVSASYDRMLKVWSLDSSRGLTTLEGHTTRVTACTTSHHGRRVVSASRDRTLKIWDLATGGVLNTIAGHAGWVIACTVTPDGRRAISASLDGTLKVWDLDLGSLLTTLEGHTDWVTACAATPDGRRVVSASQDHTLKLWDLERGALLTTLRSHASEVTACVVTPDGRRVVSASQDRTLKLWDLDTGRVLATFEGHTYRVTACAITPDGQHMISASNDQTLKIWDLERSRLLTTLEGHLSGVSACAVTLDGRHVVSASEDQMLKVWDLDAHACLLTHRGDTSYTAIAVTETNIVAGDLAGAVWFLDWPLSIAPVFRPLTSPLSDTTPDVISTTPIPATSNAHAPSSNTNRRVSRKIVIRPGRSRGHPTEFDQPAGIQPTPSESGLNSPAQPGDFVAVTALAEERTAVLESATPSQSPTNTATTSTSAMTNVQGSTRSRHVILFLAANPSGTTRLALDEECAAIERELRMTSGRDDFDFHAKWAVSVDEMMRHLNALQPTIIHFSGHGGGNADIHLQDEQHQTSSAHRDIGAVADASIQLQGEQRQPQQVRARALTQMIATAAPSTRVVVLNACFSDAVAEALRGVVDCVVGMRGAIGDDAARSFAVGFYRALGHRRSVGNAVAQAIATLAAKELPDEHLPVCRTRDDVNADQVILPSLDPHRS